MIVDCHGHYTTAPQALWDWRKQQVAGRKPDPLRISDDEIRESLEGARYINADTTAFMQFIESDLFRDFPTLRFVIPHGGGAVPYHWGRYRGLAQDMGRPPLGELLLGNVFFDTCVYHQAGIECLLKVIPADNILFAAEVVGAVRGVDPETGHYFDDTRRYLDAAAGLSAADRDKIFHGNARRVYPRWRG